MKIYFVAILLAIMAPCTVLAANTHHYGCSDFANGIGGGASCANDTITMPVGGSYAQDTGAPYADPVFDLHTPATWYVSFNYSGAGQGRVICVSYTGTIAGGDFCNSSPNTPYFSGSVSDQEFYTGAETELHQGLYFRNDDSIGPFSVSSICISDTVGGCNATTTPPSITGSGTENRLAKFTSASTIGDSLFFDDGSNTILTAGNLFMQIGSLIDTISNGAFNFGTTNATTMTFGRSGQNMIINSKLGVGTSTPTAQLHVNGDISATLIKVAANDLGLDTLTTGLLRIASTTANAITIGRVGATTTIPTLTVGKANTSLNCNSSSSPASCSDAPAGSVAMPNGQNTLVVNTSAVTADSQILVTEDFSLGSRLGVTCNTGTGRHFKISARTAGASFTIRSSANPTNNPACLSYWIVN